MHYQHVVVSGTPWERGFSHGSQARDKIQTNVNRYKVSSSLPPREDCVKYINESYIPAIEALFPDGLEEMKGIASGAMVELQDVLLLNARYDLARLTGHKVGECTSMAYLGPDDSAIVAQNWDMSAWLHDLDTIIVLESHIDPTDEPAHTDTPSGPRRIIALTEAGQLARSGMNSRGLGLCANSLWTNEDGIPSRPSLPHSLARAMYLHCPNFAAGLKTVSTFPRHVSGNLMLASLDLAMDIELTPSRKYILHPDAVDLGLDGPETFLITHANHYNHPAMTHAHASRPIDTYPGGSSLFRDKRLAQLLKTGLRHSMASSRIREQKIQIATAKGLSPPVTPPIEEHNTEVVEQLKLSRPEQPEMNFKTSSFPQQISQHVLTVDDLKTAFSDHASYPRSLCEHADKGVERYGAASSGDKTMTVACVIYDLRKGEMHISTGNPCQGERAWRKYAIEMEATTTFGL
ncbi:hypothetical protein UA08_08944 [Talaromyces atroroseus]|uniref:Acyl-coenzyme A:6-aminopenicillanic-acid-acyltransferase 40 kDa form n=1 Tax=Talaromyces atroroseus TaxID=1441469 RepID=A0A225ALT9_TALAT|nr:hypothetical protein UA08_08944 [Talaromyces atroroseus]OKL55886.1 hypothetical protein UA08_08944 [Talaromyces atroroseus]